MSARSKNVLIFTVLIIKFRFLSKLAPIFGFFMKFTKKINHHLFILNCFFGFILSYIKNCIPLNIMYPKGQPLSSIKKYFYWYWKLYQQLQITLYFSCFCQVRVVFLVIAFNFRNVFRFFQHKREILKCLNCLNILQTVQQTLHKNQLMTNLSQMKMCIFGIEWNFLRISLSKNINMKFYSWCIFNKGRI